MKQKAIYLMAAALLLAPACRQEILSGEEAGLLTARIADEAPETRTSYDNYEGKFIWNEGDEVAIHLSDGTATGHYQTMGVQPSATSAETATVILSTESMDARDYYAVYPASAVDASNYGNTTLKVNLPATYDIQDIVAGTSSTKTTDFSPVPMVAKNIGKELDFYHVGGLLRVKCAAVPAGTRSLSVTLDKGITGSFAVDLSDETAPAILAAEATGDNKTVTYIVSASGLSAETTIILNVPVPCGTYSHVNIKGYASDTTTPNLEKNYDVTLVFARHHGKKLGFDIIEYVLQHTGPTIMLEDGTIVQEVVKQYQSAGATETNGLYDSYRTPDEGVTEEVVGVTYEYAEADEDGLPVHNALTGEIVWSSTRPSTLSSVNSSGSVSKTFSANLTEYEPGIVKETVSQLIKRAENLQGKGNNGFTVGAPQDLSMYDIHGTPRAAEAPVVTANCYIVNRAGWYMFPVVYGNAIDYTKAGSSMEMVAAVYENGVHSAAYKRSSEANKEKFWYNFQNFTGTGLISTPYILDDAGGLSSSDVEAVIVWQDVENAMYSFIEVETDVVDVASSNVFWDPMAASYKSSVPYIKFHILDGSIDPDTNKEPTERVTGIRQGNAVIAVRLKAAQAIGGMTYPAGTILWSWHIWVTDGYDTDGDDKGDGLVPIPVSHYRGYYTLNMMPVQLGFCDTAEKTTYKDRVWYVRVSQTSGSAAPIIFRVVQQHANKTTISSGTYYQWGRKDPFLPADPRLNSNGTSDQRNKPAYSPAGYTITQSAQSVSFSSQPAGNVSTAIQNPHVFYSAGSASTRQWMSSNTYIPKNLWNMNDDPSSTLDEGSDYLVVKTIYDPCPPGYCVPRRQIFRRFGNDGAQSVTYNGMNAKDRTGDGEYRPDDFYIDHGHNFYTDNSKTSTILFYGDGMRGNGKAGMLVSVGTGGNYHTAAKSGRYSFYGLNFAPAQAYTEDGACAIDNGYSVCPAEEEQI